CAVDAFARAVPALQEVVLWGLCDAASATLFYAWQDRRIKGIVLVNPWVRTEAGIAEAHLRHYYFRRLLQPDLWKKIARGEFRLRESAASLGGFLTDVGKRTNDAASLPDRML